MTTHTFEDLHLLPLILDKIKKVGLKKMTKIQKICIPPSLKGFDVIGSARTGSGKTLCFVIPVYQKFLFLGWNLSNLVFSITLAPVRELCIQIIDVFRNFNLINPLFLGLLIGKTNQKKKNLKKKKNLIYIATPGCLLNAILDDKNNNFDSIQILSIDEADKILDKGFNNFLDMFLRHLPKKKQIFLYSATLTSQIKNIGRINLRKPFYGNIIRRNYQKNSIFSKNLPEISEKNFQFYSILYSQKKIDVLFSFLKSHISRKILVFFSTKKQVKFFYILFKKLKSSLNLYLTHGDMKQTKRIQNFIGFSRCRKGILFTTDMMARGIDFKSIHWVIQIDCPENIKIYLHRVGRTGRFSELGKSLLILKPNETRFLDLFKKNLIKISKVELNNNQMTLIQEKIKNIAKKKKIIQKLAQEAFFSYIRFLILQKDKNVFNIRRLDWTRLFEEYGINDFKKNHSDKSHKKQ